MPLYRQSFDLDATYDRESLGVNGVGYKFHAWIVKASHPGCTLKVRGNHGETDQLSQDWVRLRTNDYVKAKGPPDFRVTVEMEFYADEDAVEFDDPWDVV